MQGAIPPSRLWGLFSSNCSSCETEARALNYSSLLVIYSWNSRAWFFSRRSELVRTPKSVHKYRPATYCLQSNQYCNDISSHHHIYLNPQCPFIYFHVQHIFLLQTPITVLPQRLRSQHPHRRYFVTKGHCALNKSHPLAIVLCLLKQSLTACLPSARLPSARRR